MEAVLSNGPNPRGSVKNFASCRNIAQGPVIIVASGRPAIDFPIEQFADVPMITMNGAISMFADTNIDPYFYVCSDTHFRIQQPQLYAMAMQRSQRVALWQAEIEPPAGEMYLLKKANDLSLLGSLFNREPHHARSWVLWNKRARSIGFSKDMQHGYFDARTVAYLALQVAYHVGFTKVFLVGVDMNQSAGRFYEHNHANKSPCGLDQHYERRILPSMKLMARNVMSSRFAVYNLSQTSRIPRSLIPKVTIEQVRTMLGRS